MPTPTWSLVDVDPIAAEHKYTFYKPSPATIAKINPGENVKLIFRFASADAEAPDAERMWVIVDTIEADGGFTGRLDNNPRWIQDLKAGDPVAFRACHIIATEHAEPGNLVERYAKRCFVTQRILRDRARVAYLYREAPDNDDDSGWRFMANDETQEYMGVKGNVQYVSVGRVLSCDDAFVHLLDAEEGAAFVLDAASNTFLPTNIDA